jgi:hypothetical protein
MGLKRSQDGRCRVPSVGFGTVKRIAMEPGFLGEPCRRHTVPLQGGANTFNEVGNHEMNKSIFRYARQAPFHTSICKSGRIYRRMERTPEERRDILRSFIKERGLKISRWAKDSGVDKNSIAANHTVIRWF